MTRTNEEFAIDDGPSKLDLMLSLFVTDMGAITVRFQIGDIYTTMLGRDWLDVQITSARRRNQAANIWEIEGITDVQGGKTRVSIYYLSDTREGRMRFEKEFRTHGIMETPDDAKKGGGGGGE